MDYPYFVISSYAATCYAINLTLSYQKFTGATVGLFNSNIIARDLGLTDKQEVKQVSELSDEELDEKIKELNKGVQ